jgi:hypothetical protein
MLLDPCFGTDFMVKTRDKPHITVELSTDYICSASCPYFDELRPGEGFVRQGSVLRMYAFPAK